MFFAVGFVATGYSTWAPPFQSVTMIALNIDNFYFAVKKILKK
jgi:hypothetical protein